MGQGREIVSKHGCWGFSKGVVRHLVYAQPKPTTFDGSQATVFIFRRANGYPLFRPFKGLPTTYIRLPFVPSAFV
jgi:hypothetical protein